MPKDAALAKALVEKINQVYTGPIKSVRFTYDQFVDLDTLPNEPVVFIGLDNMIYFREARGVVRRDASIRLTMISNTGPVDSTSWVEKFIDAFDDLVDLVFVTPALNRTPISAETDGRFDVDRFYSHHRLVMDVLFNYGNL